MDLLSDICPGDFTATYCYFHIVGKDGFPRLFCLWAEEKKNEQLMLPPLSVWIVTFSSSWMVLCSTPGLRENKSMTPQHSEKQSSHGQECARFWERTQLQEGGRDWSFAINKGKGSHAKPPVSKSSLPAVLSTRFCCSPSAWGCQSRIAPLFIFLFCDVNQVG